MEQITLIDLVSLVTDTGFWLVMLYLYLRESKLRSDFTDMVFNWLTQDSHPESDHPTQDTG